MSTYLVLLHEDAACEAIEQLSGAVHDLAGLVSGMLGSGCAELSPVAA
ncbi:hypothetical protein [Cellulomonas sp. PhB150]|nr:hypothetical protein [Cellulomonas sp. PhB150]ROS23785.1 hypothetical protein EDF34_2846 [Cellulomonas sp. PhB150]